MSKPLTAEKVADIVLGSFGQAIKPNAKLDQLIKMLGTWSGSDKFLGLIEYTFKILVPFLNFRARLQHQAGIIPSDISPLAGKYTKLAALITDARTVFRSWGFLPIIRWLQTLERHPPQTKALLNIERLQGLAMLPFCALDVSLFLISKGILPTSISKPYSGGKPLVTLNPAQMGLWAGRCWFSFTSLQLLHLREDYKLLVLKERSLRRQKAPMAASDRQDLSNRWSTLYNEFGTNVAYCSLSLHLSVAGGLFSNPLIPNILGFVGAVGAFRGSWPAASPPPSPPVPVEMASVDGAPSST